MFLSKNNRFPVYLSPRRAIYCLASLLIIFQVGRTAEGAQALTLNKPVKRDVETGKSHIYRITLAAGQYLNIVLDAQDVEFEIKLIGPRQGKLLEVKSRRNWPTPLSLISAASGVYTLEVRPADTSAGKRYYEVKVDQLRKANASDRSSIASEKAFAEAERLRRDWLSESFLKALEKYEQARKHLSAANNAREQAYALKSSADIYYTLGQNQRAFDYYNQVLPLIKTTGDRRLEVEALNDLGGISIDVSKKDMALDYCKQAQELSKQIGSVRGEARALNNLGGYYSYLLGDKLKALDYFAESLNLWQATGEDTGQAQTLMNIGYANTDLGEIHKALTYFGRALQLWQKAKDLRGEALALTAIGLAHSSLGEMQTALEGHSRAALLLQRIGDNIGQAVTLNGRGYVFKTLGEKEKALDSYNKALQLFRDAGRQTSVAVTLGVIGELYEAMGEHERALDYFGQKLAIVRKLNNRRLEAQTLRGMGTVFGSLGNDNKALDHYSQSLSISESLQDRRGQAYSLNGAGYVYESLGDKYKAMDHYRRAVAMFRAAEDREGECSTLHNMARVSRDTGDMKEAYNNSRALLNIIESVRIKIASQELRASYFASVHQHYELYVDILMRMHRQDPNMGYDAAALEASEKARGRSLLDLLKEIGVDIRQGVDPLLLRRERELQQLLNSKAERQIALLNRTHTEEQAAAMRRQIADITFEYENVLADIRTGSPHYMGLMQPGILSLAEVQKQGLDNDTLLLEYLLGDDRSYLWAVTTNSINSYELPGRAKIERAAKELYRCLTTFNQFPSGQSARQVRLYRENIAAQYSMLAGELSRDLLDPVSPRLRAAKRLVIVADGALQYVPFASLPDPSNSKQGKDEAQPLILGYEIITLPSLSVLAVLRNEIGGRNAAPKTLAVLADPVYERDDPRIGSRGAGRRRGSNAGALSTGDDSALSNPRGREDTDERLQFQRLPSAGREASTIARLVPEKERKLALGFEANLSTATSAELGRYRILHFVTHGLIYGAHPQLYGMVLSLVDKQGHPQNGFLRLNEVYNLKLPVDLVVLSACQTALGKEIKGEGLVGLTRGFMYAGAARIVASLWKVDDRASAELMRSFYEHMIVQKMRPPAALQAAQVAMSKDRRWGFPYYWAAFVLQGEWR